MNNSTTNHSDHPVCRICFQDQNTKDLLFPCQCSGSLKYVHQSCLKIWISSKFPQISHSKCELCHFNFQIKQTQKYQCQCKNLLRSNRCLIIPIILGLQFTIAFVIYQLIKGFEEADSNSEKTFFVILILACFLIQILMIGITMIAVVKICVFKGVNKSQVLNFQPETTVISTTQRKKNMSEKETFS